MCRRAGVEAGEKRRGFYEEVLGELNSNMKLTADRQNEEVRILDIENIIALLTGMLIFPACCKLLSPIFSKKHQNDLSLKEYKKVILLHDYEERSVDEVVAHLKEHGLSIIPFRLSEK